MRQTAAKMLLIISAQSRKLYGPLDNDRLGALQKTKNFTGKINLGFGARVTRVSSCV